MISFLICFFWMTPFAFSQNSKAIQVPEVIVTEGQNSHRPRSIQWSVQENKTPSYFSVTSTEESFNGLSGVQSRSQGSPTFSIRGSAQSGRVLLLLNDIPLNFASGFGAPTIFLPREMIDKISLIKGPASLFYGSQAMSGSLNFHTKKYISPQATVVISDTDESPLPWRENTLSQRSLHLATPLINTKQDHLQISYFTEADGGDFAFQSQDQSGVRENNKTDLSRVVINGQSQREWVHWQYEALYGEQNRQSPGSLSFPFLTEEKTDGLLLSLSPHFFFSSTQSLKSRISYLGSESQFTESATITESKQETLIAQNEWIVDIIPNIHFQLFADFFSYQLQSSFLGEQKNQNLFELGPFVSFKILPNLKHQLGGRYLEYSQKFLPTVSHQYEMNKALLWLTYSEGFRNPTLSDLYSNSPFFIGNPDLSAESSKQWEIGYQLERKWGETHHNFDLRIFTIEYENFIESYEITPSFFSRQNRGEGRSQGFDLEWKAKIKNLTPFVRYNFLETKEALTGSPFRLSPRHQLSLGSEHRLNNFVFEWQNIHWMKNFDRINNQALELKDWQQWNFLLHLEIAKNTRLSLGLINAFNEAKELSRFYPEPQRRYWLSLQHIF